MHFRNRPKMIRIDPIWPILYSGASHFSRKIRRILETAFGKENNFVCYLDRNLMTWPHLVKIIFEPSKMKFTSAYGKIILRWKFTTNFAWLWVIWRWFLFVETIGQYWAVWVFVNVEYGIGIDQDHRFSDEKAETVSVGELGKTPILI